MAGERKGRGRADGHRGRHSGFGGGWRCVAAVGQWTGWTLWTWWTTWTEGFVWTKVNGWFGMPGWVSVRDCPQLSRIVRGCCYFLFFGGVPPCGGCGCPVSIWAGAWKQHATSRIISRPLGVILFFLCLCRRPLQPAVARKSRVRDPACGTLQGKRNVSKAGARGGTWAALGRPLGGQATNFGRVGSPKCLLMPSCTCSYRLFFESFIGGPCGLPPWGGRRFAAQHTAIISAYLALSRRISECLAFLEL